MLHERKKKWRKPANPGRRGKRMGRVDQDHNGAIETRPALRGMAEPGLADQQQSTNVKQSGIPHPAVPRQESQYDGDRKERETDDGHRPTGVSKK